MRIKEYTSPISGEVAMLVDDAEMPLQFANRYAFSQIEKNGKSLSSVRQALFVIFRAYLWAKTQSMDLERSLFYGDYLTHDQVQDLVDFIQYTSVTQRNILRYKKEQPPHSSKHRGNINTFKKTVEFKYHRTSDQVYANRLNALRKFLRWVLRERLAQRISTSSSVKDRSAIAIEVINTSTPKVRRRSDNEKLEAVDLDIIQRISEVLQPEHPDNPFSSQFVRRRNHLLFLLLIESGARRREVYETTSKDIIASTLQYDIKVTKTIPRTLPVSPKLIDAFETFYREHWQHLTGSGKKAGYLFVKSSGERMTLRALNHVIETVREKIPEVPEWFHTHTIRRSFNHRLSLLIDAKRKEGISISEEEERKIRNRLNGWAKKSNMGEIYNARHLREKADKLAEKALNNIWAEVRIK